LKKQEPRRNTPQLFNHSDKNQISSIALITGTGIAPLLWIYLQAGGQYPLNGVLPITPDHVAVVKKTASVSDKVVISLERKLKELTVLYEISKLIGSTLNCQEVFSDVLGTLTWG
jgi:hypothetical protein